MKIHTGDTVLIIAGKDKGKQGTVMRVLGEKNRLIIESINMRVRHIRKTAQGPGQRISYEASIAASNVMLLDPKTKKPTRVGYRVDPVTGNKVRYAKVSGEVLPVRSKTKGTGGKKKAEKKVTKGTEGAEVTEVAEVAKEAAAPPKKQPFWKRAMGGGAANDAAETGSAPEATVHPTTTPVRRSRESS